MNNEATIVVIIGFIIIIAALIYIKYDDRY